MALLERRPNPKCAACGGKGELLLQGLPVKVKCPCEETSEVYRLHLSTQEFVRVKECAIHCERLVAQGHWTKPEADREYRRQMVDILGRELTHAMRGKSVEVLVDWSSAARGGHARN